MISFNDKHPDVLAEFKSGNFVVHKTSKKFSAMALKKVKGSGWGLLG